MGRLRLENLDLWYTQTVHAVDDVNLIIEDGEFCVLLGPSGCGKTSTLRMIAGFITPSSGAIWLDDQRIDPLYPGDRNISMVFQSYALYPNRTISQQFKFALKKLNLPKDEVQKRIDDTAQFMHLEEYLDQYPAALSSGQRQRVGVGRALIRQPRLFLMDEPLSQLDARLRVETRGTLRHLQKELDITTVYVTHDQLEAQGVADKIVVMDRGRILQVGSPREIYENPSTLFVAGFIGTPSMNFATGNLEKTESGWYFQHPEFQLKLQPQVLDRFERIPEPGSEIVFGIRPEHIQTTMEKNDYTVPTKIYMVEPQSNELILDVSLNGLIFKTRQDKRELGFRPKLEQDVYIMPNQDKLLIFDEQTEARLV